MTNKLVFTAIALLLAACSSENTGGGSAASGTAGSGPGKVETVPGPSSPCLGKFGTNDPNLNNHQFVLKANGVCTYSYEAFPKLAYACAYTVDNVGVVTAVYGPEGTKLSWAASGGFSEDCSVWQTDALGLELKQQP